MSWQPIATAPKDGSPFIACSGTVFPISVSWNKNRRAFRVVTLGWGIDNNCGDAAPFEFEPTHWMSLPNPPANAEAVL